MRFVWALFLLISMSVAWAKEPLMTQCGNEKPLIQIIGLETQEKSQAIPSSCSASKPSKRVKHKKHQPLIKK